MERNINEMAQCIIISGIDGSGKSTIINETKKALESKGKKVGYIWLRFNHYLTKGMHAMARVFGLSVKVHNEMGDVWQHRLYKNQLFCSFYIFTTYLDTWMSKLKYNKMAKENDIVICDRWITDILVDLATKTHRKDFLNSKWPNRFMRILPKGARLFVVVRNTEALIDCRLENRVDPDFRFRLEIYKDLCKKEYVRVVDNNGTIENSVKQIINKL
jgi:thymidylate kinase